MNKIRFQKVIRFALDMHVVPSTFLQIAALDINTWPQFAIGDYSNTETGLSARSFSFTHQLRQPTTIFLYNSNHGRRCYTTAEPCLFFSCFISLVVWL
jgi:hypothetical protein